MWFSRPPILEYKNFFKLGYIVAHYQRVDIIQSIKCYWENIPKIIHTYLLTEVNI